MDSTVPTQRITGQTNESTELGADPGSTHSRSKGLPHPWRDTRADGRAGSSGYGLGLFNPTDPYAVAVGHTGGNFGYVYWAGCLPEEGAVIVVLSDREFDDVDGMARHLVGVIAD